MHHCNTDVQEARRRCSSAEKLAAPEAIDREPVDREEAEEHGAQAKKKYSRVVKLEESLLTAATMPNARKIRFAMYRGLEEPEQHGVGFAGRRSARPP